MFCQNFKNMGWGVFEWQMYFWSKNTKNRGSLGDSKSLRGCGWGVSHKKGVVKALHNVTWNMGVLPPHLGAHVQDSLPYHVAYHM